MWRRQFVCVSWMALRPVGTWFPFLVEEVFVFIDAGDGLDEGVRIGAGDGDVGDVVAHAAAEEGDGEFLVAADEEEILGLAEGGESAVAAGEGFDIDEGGVALAFDDDGVNFLLFCAGIGDDGALGDLPIAVESAVAKLVNADCDAIEVEIGELSVGGGAEVNTAVGAEGEEIHEHGVVGVIDRVSEGGSFDDGIDDGAAVAALDEALVGGIDVAVEDARDVVAVIDADEFAAEGVAVAMFEEDLLAGVGAGGIKIHGEVLAVEGEGGEGHALRGLGLGDADGGGILDDFVGVGEGLLRIPELEAA